MIGGWTPEEKDSRLYQKAKAHRNLRQRFLVFNEEILSRNS